MVKLYMCNMLGPRSPSPGDLYWPLSLSVALIISLISLCKWFRCIKQSWFLLYQGQTVFSECLILQVKAPWLFKIVWLNHVQQVVMYNNTWVFCNTTAGALWLASSTVCIVMLCFFVRCHVSLVSLILIFIFSFVTCLMPIGFWFFVRVLQLLYIPGNRWLINCMGHLTDVMCKHFLLYFVWYSQWLL